MDVHQQARVLYEQGRPHDAFEVAQRACEQQPKDAEAWWLLACICRHTGMPSTSDDAFRRAVELAPEHFALPIRVTASRFRELARQARPHGAPGFQTSDLPDPDSRPDSRWAREGGHLVLYQTNHENHASSEEGLLDLLRESWGEVLASNR